MYDDNKYNNENGSTENTGTENTGNDYANETQKHFETESNDFDLRHRNPVNHVEEVKREHSDFDSVRNEVESRGQENIPPVQSYYSGNVETPTEATNVDGSNNESYGQYYGNHEAQEPHYNNYNYYGYDTGYNSQGYKAGDNTSMVQVKPKKKMKTRTKFIAIMMAALLVVSLLSSGITYLFLKNINAENNSIVKTSQENEVKEDSEEKDVTNESTENEGATNSISDVVKKTAPSVVEITTEIAQYDRFLGQRVSEGAGSGVIISEDGYIVTNYHVVEGADKIKVTTHDGTTYDGKLVGISSVNDLAVIKIEGTGLQKATFADSDKIEVGQTAIAIGNPLGTLGGTVTEGIISAKDRDIQIDEKTMTLLQTSAAVNPGNSGGGLFNSSGELIGVVVAKSSGSGVEGLGFAIPSNLVKEVSDDIITNGSVENDVPQNDVPQNDVPQETPSNENENEGGTGDLEDFFKEFFEKRAS